MFGLYQAFQRLRAAVEEMADKFEAGNRQIEARQEPVKDVIEEGNGRRRVANQTSKG